MSEQVEPNPQPQPATPPPGIRQRMEKLLADYGPVVLVVHLTLFVLTLAGFAVAFRLGVHVEGTAGKAGLLGAAYVATELTKLPRFAATVALTPWIASLWRRFRARSSTGS